MRLTCKIRDTLYHRTYVLRLLEVLFEYFPVSLTSFCENIIHIWAAPVVKGMSIKDFNYSKASLQTTNPHPSPNSTPKHCNKIHLNPKTKISPEPFQLHFNLRARSPSFQNIFFSVWILSQIQIPLNNFSPTYTHENWSINWRLLHLLLCHYL